MSHEQELVTRAREGDRDALDALVALSKDVVYNLAVRMLGTPSDAEDATQEILIRIVTNLDSYRGESAFKTWVYRVAANQLLKERAKGRGRHESFEGVSERLDNGLASDAGDVEDPLLLKEAKLHCTTGMLLCLDRDHRLAFILGEILELSSEDGAQVLGIAEDAFRKRVSRARARMGEFMSSSCGLVNPDRPCRCGKQMANALAKGWVSKEKLQWATHPTLGPDPKRVEEIDHILRSVEVFRSHPRYAAPDGVVAGLKELISKRKGLLS